MKTVQTTVRLPENLTQQLARVSNQVGISQSDLIRAAIAKFLADTEHAGAVHLPLQVAEDRSATDYGAPSD